MCNVNYTLHSIAKEQKSTMHELHNDLGSLDEVASRMKRNDHLEDDNGKIAMTDCASA